MMQRVQSDQDILIMAYEGAARTREILVNKGFIEVK
jgi:hypothetical protein